MITVTDVDRSTDAAWDAFIGATPGGSHKQTSSWARLKAMQGWRAERVEVRHDTDGRILAGAQVLVRSLPGGPATGKIAYVVKGPLVADGGAALADRVLEELQRSCRREGVRVLIVQPPEGAAPIEPALTGQGYIHSPVSLAPTSTVITDLTPGPEALWDGLSKNLRHNIRRSRSKGLTVRVGGRADLAAFHRVLKIASQRLGYPIFPLAYYERMWDEFLPIEGVQLFLAEVDGDLVSAHLCLTYRDTTFLKALAWSGEHPSLNANNPLTWEIIRWGAERGLTRYDPEGIPDELASALLSGRDPATLQVKGAHAYKLKWGGQVEVFPQPQLLVTNPVVRRVVRSMPERTRLRAMRELRRRFRPMGGI